METLHEKVLNQLKTKARLLGANCILNYKVDINEISGKNKSMLLISAIGTAVIVETTSNLNKNLVQSSIELDTFLAFEKSKIIENKIKNQSIDFNDEVWSFITQNELHVLFPYVLEYFNYQISSDNYGKDVQDLLFNKFILYYM